MTQTIHSTAIIDPNAIIGSNVTIGPYCAVGPRVTLGDNVTLKSHAVVDGYTQIGAKTIIHPFASVGGEPQGRREDHDDNCILVIGDNNIIREYVTMQPGSIVGGRITKVGDNGQFMAGVHIAHDCQVGDNVIMANMATLAGHVEVGDFAFIGGLSAVHQFVRIGHHAYIGGKSAIGGNIIPYAFVDSDTDNVRGLNLVGLKRMGLDRSEILSMSKAFKDIFHSELPLLEAIEKTSKTYKSQARVMDLISFIQADSKRPTTTAVKPNAA